MSGAAKRTRHHPGCYGSYAPTTPVQCQQEERDQHGPTNPLLFVTIKTIYYIALPPAIATPPGPLQGSLGPFGPEVSPGVSPKTGVSPEVSHGVSPGPFGPGLRSVQKVSRECPRSVWDTFSTLQGHSRDTFWTLRSLGPKGPGDTPWDTPGDTPVFGDTPGDTSGPKGPRDPCSGPGGSQTYYSFLSRKVFLQFQTCDLT